MAEHVSDLLTRLTPQQRTAIETPCLLAEECAHPRYAIVLPLGSLVLTVDSGYE